jgi:RNA polymerase sigma-70 factor (ECF subfamily)
MTDAERETALIRMMEQYRTQLIRLAYLYLGDLALAEDAVQETFLKAYAHMNSFHGDSSEKTWLIRISINTCKDIRRGAWLRWMKRTVSLDAAPEPGQEDCYHDDTVLQAVMQLPEKDKQVILLRYYQEMKVSEIACVLKIPESNATSRLRRARDRLQKSLEGWYLDEA